MNIIVAYRGIPHAPGRETGAGLARAFRRLGHSVYEYGNYYRTSRRLTSNHAPANPDLLVYCECNDDDPQYYELRSMRTTHKVYWDFDISTHPMRTLLFMWRMGFDQVYYANLLYEKTFKSLYPHSQLLPYAIDDEFHRKMPEVEKSIDVGLVGSPYPARVTLISTLAHAGINAQLLNGFYGGDLVRLINSLKIHLNYNTTKTRGLLVGRVWETTGCGTALLTQREDFIDMFFEDNRHVAMYSNPEECIFRCRQLLTDKDLREKIALDGMLLVHQQHTYLCRAKAILDAYLVRKSADMARQRNLTWIGQVARIAAREGIRSKPLGD